MGHVQFAQKKEMFQKKKKSHFKLSECLLEEKPIKFNTHFLRFTQKMNEMVFAFKGHALWLGWQIHSQMTNSAS